MKTTGNYCSITEFDIDHEINHHVDILKLNLLTINDYNNKSDAKLIKKALIETILEQI